MMRFVTLLKVLSPVLLCVALLHLVLGLHADKLLGVPLSAEVLTEPSLSSQNRFYGVSYAIYGVLVWICAGDIQRYKPVLQALFWVTFLAGLSRLLAWYQYGAPTWMVLGLMMSELLVPPLMLMALARTRASPQTLNP